MTYAPDISAEITAELDILSINLKRELAAIMPVNPTCADILRMVVVNDVSSSVALDIGELSSYTDKTLAFIKRRVTVMAKRGWLRYSRRTGRVKMGDLFAMKEHSVIRELDFLISQTQNSLKELQTEHKSEDFAFA